jgi:tetratricopeptide (TPR) repeat protein
LSEAEALLASGNREGATARLREATQLDPSNIEAHRRLGDLLFRQGARREAIDEYRAIIQINSNDTMAWRALASAQLAEGLYHDAIESYHRLTAISFGTANPDYSVLLSLANALRLAGHVEEARLVYQRASESSNVDVARTAQQRLAELPLETKAPSPEPSRNTHATADQTRTASETVVSSEPAPIPLTKPTPAATPALSANEHFNRGVTLWRSNRTAAIAEFHAAANGGNADAYYYLGLSIVEGHDPRTLNHAELVAALNFFQKARYGKFSAQARQYEDQLGKEYDLRRQKQ